MTLAGALYTVSALPKRDPLWQAAMYRLDKEWVESDYDTKKLARRLKCSVRHAQRLVVAYHPEYAEPEKASNKKAKTPTRR